MPVKYYSQHSQDELLDTHVFKGLKKGVFVDVGAWDGVCFSNTLFFEKEREWNGIHIEPLPDRYAELVQNRPKSINLNLAISDSEGQGEFLAISGNTGMLSGLKSNYDERHLQRINQEISESNAEAKTIQVPVRRLDSIFREFNLRRVHYLSIDAEGSEMNILRSIDFTSTFIDVIGFENNYRDQGSDMLEFLKQRGYVRLPIQHPEDVFVVHTSSPFSHLKRSFLF